MRNIPFLFLLSCILSFSACGLTSSTKSLPEEPDTANISETRFPDESAPRLSPIPKGSVVAKLTFDEPLAKDALCLKLDLVRKDLKGRKAVLRNLEVRGQELYYAANRQGKDPLLTLKIVLRESELKKIAPLQQQQKLSFQCKKWGRSISGNNAPKGYVELKVPFSEEKHPEFNAPTCAYLSFEDFPNKAYRSKRYRISAIAHTTVTGKSAVNEGKPSGVPYLSALTIEVPKSDATQVANDLASHPFGLKCLERRKLKAVKRK